MIRQGDLKLIAITRLKEAKILYKSGLYDGAAYLCGYVVEASLKATICKNLKISEYPDDDSNIKNAKTIFYSHDFDRLLLLAGLQRNMSLTNRRNKELFKNWSLLTRWKPDHRYVIKEYTKAEVRDLLSALENKPSGFFTWIQKRW